jgi:hypothetical protein
VHGPIAINSQTNISKVVECFSFYELCSLPPLEVMVAYEDNEELRNGSQLVEDIKEYIRYFINELNDKQSENTIPYNFSRTVYISPKKNRENMVELAMGSFCLYNILKFVEKVGRI